MNSEDLEIDDAEAQRVFNAARGYWELNMPAQALEELQPLREAYGHTPAMAEMEMLLYVAMKDWDRGLEAALKLRALRRSDTSSWFQAAYCLHELGRTEEALITLDEAPHSIRQEAVWFYNRGCYLAILERRSEALSAVRKAVSLDNTFAKTAQRDPDLVGVIGQL